jgi:hypothetical protein
MEYHRKGIPLFVDKGVYKKNCNMNIGRRVRLKIYKREGLYFLSTMDQGANKLLNMPKNERHLNYVTLKESRECSFNDNYLNFLCGTNLSRSPKIMHVGFRSCGDLVRRQHIEMLISYNSLTP